MSLFVLDTSLHNVYIFFSVYSMLRCLLQFGLGRNIRSGFFETRVLAAIRFGVFGPDCPRILIFLPY
jgi:hypothetical protein